ncbi:MAG TPA: phospholipase D-like domain-containing protein [Terriglobales bacterium]
MAPILAEFTVSTTFLVFAYVALGILSVLVFVGLFGPGLGYRVSAGVESANDSDEFLHMLEALVDAKINRNTALTVLTNGHCFYEEELAAISEAQHSVNLEAYIFHPGEITERFVRALEERARAGVQVNLVLDSMGNTRTPKKHFTRLEAAGGKVAWYNGSKWDKLPRFNNRTHRELLVIDGRLGFIGGAGVADQWWKGSKGKPTWRDTVVRVEGDAVAHLQATLAENFLEAHGEVLTDPEYFATRPAQGNGPVLVINSTPSGGGATRSRILFQVLLASARKSIHITTPYFLPDKSMRDELMRAVRRGVEVKILVPGKKSDIWLTRNSSRAAYGELLKAGASIHEYQPSMIHAKVLLIDGLWAVVGSTNFDNRSFGLNDEVNLAACESDVCERLEEDFQRDLQHSENITYEGWRHRPVLERAPELLGWVLQREQ